MPYVGHIPADETIGSELSKLFDTITKVKQQRRRRDIEGGFLKVLASGGTPEEMQRQISQVMLQQPEPTGGFLGGILDAFNPMTAARMGRTSLEDAIMGRMMEGALQTPLETARTKYYEQGGRGKDKPITRANISTSRTKALQILKKTPTRFWKPGVPNYTKESLMESYNQYRLDRGYDSLREEDKNKLDAVWDKTIGYLNRKPGMATKGEFEWDPNDPDIQAIRKGTQRQKEIGFEDTAQAQSAPDVQLDPYWDKLSLKQKEDIWRQFQQDPTSIKAILEMIQSATP